MTKYPRARLTAGSWLAILFCEGLAVGLSLLLRGDSLGVVVPAMFLLVVIIISHVFSRLAGIVTAVVASVVFAVVLFEPYGSLLISDATDRLALTCFVLAALAVVLMSPGSRARNLAHSRCQR